MAHTGVGSSGIGHAHTINRVRHHQLRPFFEQPCCRLGVLFVNALSNGYMLGPAVGVGALGQYFIRGELEVSMCQMDREPLQLAVPGERITDIPQAGKIVVIQRRRILKLWQHRPLHGLN